MTNMLAALRPRLRGFLWLLGLGLAGAALVLVGVVLGRTYGASWPPTLGLPLRDRGSLGRRLEPVFTSEEKQALKENLRGSIRLKTVSFSEDEQNITALAEFEPYIRKGIYFSDLDRRNGISSIEDLILLYE
ncbi:N-fatty-acyl-amino acid synthase/hydrolase PM20D1-like [Anolis carolinensis]|uniref:N-fatty-acyl-amino acid synthase/hydrolase PM20D1-like n=1 Tax=Anolis carolinensis TaxID=28377 RepID=UPI002F2B6B57